MNGLYLRLSPKERELPIYVTSVGTNYKQSPVNRAHEHHHIFYIEKGRALFETPMGTFIIPENNVIFAKASLPLKYRAYDEELYLSFVTISGVAANTIVSHFNADDFSYYENSAIYQKLLTCFNSAKKFSSAETLSRRAYDIFVTYFVDHSKSTISKPLAIAKDFIKGNFQKDISVADIAEAAGVSQSLLYQLFKSEEKCSPMEFLRRARIQRACNLLLCDDTSKIDAIASDCGFWDTSYFCKVFKAEMGCSPAKYRKINQENRYNSG